MAATGANIFQTRPQLEICHRDGGSFIAQYGNVLVGLSTGQNSYAGLEASYKLQERLRALYPDGFAKVVITGGGARMPSPDVRERVNKLVADFARNTLAVALVFEGEGLWLSSMRMVTRAMMLATSSSFPQNSLSTVSEAVPWLASQCGSAAQFDASGLIAAIAAAR